MRILSLLLCLCLLVAVPAQQRSKGKQQTPTELRRNLDAVRKKQQQARQELRQTRRAAVEVSADIKRVDEKLEEVSSSLEDTSQRLDMARIQQKRLAKELEEATVKLDSKKEQVRKRLKRVYMRGETALVSAFVGTESIGDLASRKVIVERIARQDKRLFDDLSDLRDSVQSKKKRQDELVREVGQLAMRQKAQQRQLEINKTQKKGYLGELRERQGKLEDLVAQFEADERSIQARIAAAASRPGARANLPAFTGRFAKPTNGRVTSNFGMRFHPILRTNRMHNGIDFGAPHGSPIYAAADGVVISASYMGGYGNTVIIDHGGGITTLYAHCSSMSVSSGQQVQRGQVIARVGSTGLSTGPHLHWEVRVNGTPVNPMGRF
jgi:murein DD-endopeptidase MepM/ murein hydrolase activator NlpD